MFVVLSTRRFDFLKLFCWWFRFRFPKPACWRGSSVGNCLVGKSIPRDPPFPMQYALIVGGASCLRIFSYRRINFGYGIGLFCCPWVTIARRYGVRSSALGAVATSLEQFNVIVQQVTVTSCLRWCRRVWKKFCEAWLPHVGCGAQHRYHSTMRADWRVFTACGSLYTRARAHDYLFDGGRFEARSLHSISPRYVIYWSHTIFTELQKPGRPLWIGDVDEFMTRLSAGMVLTPSDADELGVQLHCEEEEKCRCNEEKKENFFMKRRSMCMWHVCVLSATKICCQPLFSPFIFLYLCIFSYLPT